MVSSLAVNEKKIPVDSMEFGCAVSAETVQAVGEHLVVVYESTLPILGEMSHQCIRPYGPNTVGVIPRNTDGM
jgi:hypothetical protein